MQVCESPDARARELLRNLLPEGQWTRFERTGILEVCGRRRIYHISTAGQTRVLDLRSGRPVASACLQLSLPSPVHDRIIAEYVLIRNDEDLYWKIANTFPVELDALTPGVFAAALLDIVLFAIFLARLTGG